MGRFIIPNKTLNKQYALISILCHSESIDLFKLIKNLKKTKYIEFLIVLDGIKKIYQLNFLRNFEKRINIRSLKKCGISKCRNFCLDYAIKKKFSIVVFLDSDCEPETNAVTVHIKKNQKYKNFQVLGGSVKPTFLRKETSLVTKIDGMLSWFGAIQQNHDQEIKFPYHLPTLNMSIKIDFIKKNKIRFNEVLETGEDLQFCNDIRKAGGKIMSISNSQVHHNDREGLFNVINHQATWGRHQFYTFYKFFFIKSIIFNFLFLILFMPVLPFFGLIIASITIYPWLKKSFQYVKYFLIIYLFCMIKCFYSYLECINDLKNYFIRKKKFNIFQ